MSKIKQNRAKEYQDLHKDSKNQIKVISRDGATIGYVIGEASPYTGEAGYSPRLNVLWSDGSITRCCTRGMKTYRKKHWKIL